MADNTYLVERSITIAASTERVYEEVVDFHRWVGWSPWEGRDPELTRTFSGAPAGVGSVYRWSGNRKAGSGQMSVTTATPTSRVEIALQFEKPFRASNDVVFTLRPEGPGCSVTWSMTGRKTLVTKVLGVFKSMDAFLGPDFETGLAQLKTVSELAAQQ